MAAFPFGCLVKHVKTGNVYEITMDPRETRIEAGCTPAYGYRAWVDQGLTGPTWIRPQAEMEDGRFVRIPDSYADRYGEGYPT